MKTARRRKVGVICGIGVEMTDLQARKVGEEVVRTLKRIPVLKGPIWVQVESLPPADPEECPIVAVTTSQGDVSYFNGEGTQVGKPEE